MIGSLDGLVVVDLTHALAGPYCTYLMSAYGATVYKVEGVDTFDLGRTWGPPFIGTEASFFLGLNAGKRSLAVDLKDPRGLELVIKLVESADVLIENFRPGTAERLGLDYAKVHRRNPRLVYCSISGYGQTGPRRDDPAMDLILQASSGLIAATGTPAGDLVRCGHSVADVSAGMFALIGILMALRSRDQTGHGQWVDVSMLDVMISSMASNYAYFFGNGAPAKPMGTAFGTVVPYACFRTVDGNLAIAVGSDRLWKAFCVAIERTDLTDHPSFRTNALRVENRTELEPMLAEIFRRRASVDWLETLGRHGIPAAEVRDVAQVVADPHSAERGMFPTVDHPTAGRVRVTGPPLKFSDTRGAIERSAPLLGQHTREILTTVLGLSTDAVDGLERDGVIATSTA